MVLQEYIPDPALMDYVRTIRLVNYCLKFDGNLPVKPYPPRPEHCLSFYPRDLEQVDYHTSGVKAGNLSAVVFGQQTELTKRLVGSDFLIIQVVFKPGGLYRITGIPSELLTNRYIDAHVVFAQEIRDVNCQINDCQTFNQMVHVVERFLLKEIKKACRDAHALDVVIFRLFSSPFIPGVDFLAKAACQSVRSFERHFKQRMGVSPKYYLKVMRFESAFRMRNRCPNLPWVDIAIACGYYDYQHLAKDYLELTGFYPNQFHELDMKSPERLFGEADTY